MTNIKVNEKKRAIEVSKRFGTAASKFGTEEYKALQEVRRDYPGFKVVTIKSKSSEKKNGYKGLTYDYMEKYIKNHDDDKNTIMNEFLDLRGKTDEAKEACAESVSYLEIREWFLKKYPAIEKFHKDREELLKAG